MALKNCQSGETGGDLEVQIQKQGARTDNKDGIKTLGDMYRNIYERQFREKETVMKGTTLS